MEGDESKAGEEEMKDGEGMPPPPNEGNKPPETEDDKRDRKKER